MRHPRTTQWDLTGRKKKLKLFEINFVILQFVKLNKKGGNYDTEQEIETKQWRQKPFQKNGI